MSGRTVLKASPKDLKHLAEILKTEREIERLKSTAALLERAKSLGGRRIHTTLYIEQSYDALVRAVAEFTGVTKQDVLRKYITDGLERDVKVIEQHTKKK